MSHIQLTKRHNRLCIADTDEVDFARVTKHLQFVKRKYESNLLSAKNHQPKKHDDEEEKTLNNGEGANAATVAAAAEQANGQPIPNTKPLPLDKGHTLLARIRHSLRLRQESKKQEQPRSGKTSKDSTNSTASTATTGNVALTDENELLWHGQITLGGQAIQVDFDTGSSDIILNQGSYTPGKTATDTNQSFQTGYGDGTTAKGKIYLDSLEIGGLQANGAAIGLADSKFLNAQEGDSGIAGMAFQPLVQLGGQAPFFDVLLQANVLSSPTFTFTLRKDNPSLFLGGIPSEVQGTPTYVDVDASQGFWQTDASVNGLATKGIHDTGTTLIVAPTAFAKSLFEKLGLQTFTQDGTLYGTFASTADTPQITLKFGDFTQQLASETLTIGQTNDGKQVLSIVGSEVGIDGIIFGDSWLRNVVAVFSREQSPKVGFVPQ